LRGKGPSDHKEKVCLKDAPPSKKAGGVASCRKKGKIPKKRVKIGGELALLGERSTHFLKDRQCLSRGQREDLKFLAKRKEPQLTASPEGGRCRLDLICGPGVEKPAFLGRRGKPQSLRKANYPEDYKLPTSGGRRLFGRGYLGGGSSEEKPGKKNRFS